MMRKAPVTLKDVALFGGLTAMFALVTALTLAAIASPPDFKSRLDGLDRRVAETRSLDRRGRGASPPLGTVCNHGLAQQAEALRRDLTASAGALNLKLAGLILAEEEVAGVGGRLRQLTVRFSNTGSYDDILRALSALDERRPTLFADAIDISANDADFTLDFKGRLYCAA